MYAQEPATEPYLSRLNPVHILMLSLCKIHVVLPPVSRRPTLLFPITILHAFVSPAICFARPILFFGQYGFSRAVFFSLLFPFSLVEMVS